MVLSGQTAHTNRLDRCTLRATVSGTFRKAIDDVQDSVRDLSDAGVLVLSPADPRIVDQFGDFVFVASDQVRHLRTVQSRHLAAITASDFLWLVAPDGYVGTSAAMEIGYAAARQIPVYCRDVPTDLTLRQWVTVVESIDGAIERHPARRELRAQESVLVDPAPSLQTAHDELIVAQRGLLGAPTIDQTAEAEQALRRLRERLIVP
jgi:hypothetical protein